MIYIFYISFFLKYNTVDEKVKKGMISVETIFPREENAEHIFKKILENNDACERLRELFYEEFANSGDRDLSEKQFVKALFDAYQNRDLSAFLMEICGNSMFDLLRNAFLIPMRFNDKGVTNPVRLTDAEGELIKQTSVNKQISQKQYKMFQQISDQADDIPDYEICLAYGFREKHDYRNKNEINTMKIGEHIKLKISNHSTPQAIKALRKGFVDFSIVTTPLYCEHPLQSQRLCSFRDILIGGPSYRDIGFSPKRLRDLQDFPFISLNEGTATRNFYEKYFYQNQLVFSPDMETATTNQILSLVQHDLGIGFCPEALAKDYLDRGEIIEIPVKEHANPRDICLLTDSTRPIGIAGKKLLEILMDSEG